MYYLPTYLPDIRCNGIRFVNSQEWPQSSSAAALFLCDFEGFAVNVELILLFRVDRKAGEYRIIGGGEPIMGSTIKNKRRQIVWHQVAKNTKSAEFHCLLRPKRPENRGQRKLTQLPQPSAYVHISPALSGLTTTDDCPKTPTIGSKPAFSDQDLAQGARLDISCTATVSTKNRPLKLYYLTPTFFIILCTSNSPSPELITDVFPEREVDCFTVTHTDIDCTVRGSSEDVDMAFYPKQCYFRREVVGGSLIRRIQFSVAQLRREDFGAHVFCETVSFTPGDTHIPQLRAWLSSSVNIVRFTMAPQIAKLYFDEDSQTWVCVAMGYPLPKKAGMSLRRSSTVQLGRQLGLYVTYVNSTQPQLLHQKLLPRSTEINSTYVTQMHFTPPFPLPGGLRNGTAVIRCAIGDAYRDFTTHISIGLPSDEPIVWQPTRGAAGSGVFHDCTIVVEAQTYIRQVSLHRVTETEWLRYDITVAVSIVLEDSDGKLAYLPARSIKIQRLGPWMNSKNTRTLALLHSQLENLSFSLTLAPSTEFDSDQYYCGAQTVNSTRLRTDPHVQLVLGRAKQVSFGYRQLDADPLWKHGARSLAVAKPIHYRCVAWTTNPSDRTVPNFEVLLSPSERADPNLNLTEVSNPKGVVLRIIDQHRPVAKAGPLEHFSYRFMNGSVIQNVTISGLKAECAPPVVVWMPRDLRSYPLKSNITCKADKDCSKMKVKWDWIAGPIPPLGLASNSMNAWNISKSGTLFLNRLPRGGDYVFRCTVYCTCENEETSGTAQISIYIESELDAGEEDRSEETARFREPEGDISIEESENERDLHKISEVLSDPAAGLDLLDSKEKQLLKEKLSSLLDRSDGKSPLSPTDEWELRNQLESLVPRVDGQPSDSPGGNRLLGQLLDELSVAEGGILPEAREAIAPTEADSPSEAESSILLKAIKKLLDKKKASGELMSDPLAKYGEYREMKEIQGISEPEEISSFRSYPDDVRRIPPRRLDVAQMEAMSGALHVPGGGAPSISSRVLGGLGELRPGVVGLTDRRDATIVSDMVGAKRFGDRGAGEIQANLRAFGGLIGLDGLSGDGGLPGVAIGQPRGPLDAASQDAVMGLLSAGRLGIDGVPGGAGGLSRGQLDALSQAGRIGSTAGGEFDIGGLPGGSAGIYPDLPSALAQASPRTSGFIPGTNAFAGLRTEDLAAGRFSDGTVPLDERQKRLRSRAALAGILSSDFSRELDRFAKMVQTAPTLDNVLDTTVFKRSDSVMSPDIDTTGQAPSAMELLNNMPVDGQSLNRYSKYVIQRDGGPAKLERRLTNLFAQERQKTGKPAALDGTTLTDLLQSGPGGRTPPMMSPVSPRAPHGLQPTDAESADLSALQADGRIRQVVRLLSPLNRFSPEEIPISQPSKFESGVTQAHQNMLLSDHSARPNPRSVGTRGPRYSVGESEEFGGLFRDAEREALFRSAEDTVTSEAGLREKRLVHGRASRWPVTTHEKEEGIDRRALDSASFPGYEAGDAVADPFGLSDPGHVPNILRSRGPRSKGLHPDRSSKFLLYRSPPHGFDSSTGMYLGRTTVQFGDSFRGDLPTQPPVVSLLKGDIRDSMVLADPSFGKSNWVLDPQSNSSRWTDANLVTVFQPTLPEFGHRSPVMTGIFPPVDDKRPYTGHIVVPNDLVIGKSDIDPAKRAWWGGAKVGERDTGPTVRVMHSMGSTWPLLKIEGRQRSIESSWLNPFGLQSTLDTVKDLAMGDQKAKYSEVIIDPGLIRLPGIATFRCPTVQGRTRRGYSPNTVTWFRSSGVNILDSSDTEGILRFSLTVHDIAPISRRFQQSMRAYIYPPHKWMEAHTLDLVRLEPNDAGFYTCVTSMKSAGNRPSEFNITKSSRKPLCLISPVSQPILTLVPFSSMNRTNNSDDSETGCFLERDVIQATCEGNAYRLFCEQPDLIANGYRLVTTNFSVQIHIRSPKGGYLTFPIPSAMATVKPLTVPIGDGVFTSTQQWTFEMLPEYHEAYVTCTVQPELVQPGVSSPVYWDWLELEFRKSHKERLIHRSKPVKVCSAFGEEVPEIHPNPKGVAPNRLEIVAVRPGEVLTCSVKSGSTPPMLNVSTILPNELYSFERQPLNKLDVMLDSRRSVSDWVTRTHSRTTQVIIPSSGSLDRIYFCVCGEGNRNTTKQFILAIQRPTDTWLEGTLSIWSGIVIVAAVTLSTLVSVSNLIYRFRNRYRRWSEE
ncbi:hypothetical protein CRM22_010737 [Opisthorchis felineus]|uniref:Ig-like domain-containing protein n=2 Tax=Opisthorchis felineus TaxID=147828 RepID=A0A4S2KPB9_OPIFE|nr:hypothetical protein CRM22_010737 [Opisthorchis felineus]